MKKSYMNEKDEYKCKDCRFSCRLWHTMEEHKKTHLPQIPRKIREVT